MFFFHCRSEPTNPVPALQSSSKAAELSSALPVPAWHWGPGKQDFPGIRSLQLLCFVENHVCEGRGSRQELSSLWLFIACPGWLLCHGHSPRVPGGSLVLWEGFKLPRAVTGGLENKHWNEIQNTSTELMHYLQCCQADTVAVLTPQCLFSGWWGGGREEEQPPQALGSRLLGPGG